MRKGIGYVLLATLFFSACVTSSQRFNRLSSGMSQKEVKRIVGEPQDKDLKEGKETWYYTVIALEGQKQKFVAFKSGRVVEIGSKEGSIFESFKSNNEQEKTTVIYSQAAEPPQCIEKYGKKKCGYGCIESYGQLHCGSQPGMYCIEAYGKVKCGFGCIEAHGQLKCGSHANSVCEEKYGEINCS